jgi:dUTP pyrophosphatase
MAVRIKIKSDTGILPTKGTTGSAGYDIRARLDEDAVLKPFERRLFKTGIYIEIPEGYEAQMRPRSGLAIRNGVTLVNGVGTIDSDYRGEIMIPLINLGQEDVVIKDGDRIAQMIIARYEDIEWDEESGFTGTQRGTGGFGHTGKE